MMQTKNNFKHSKFKALLSVLFLVGIALPSFSQTSEQEQTSTELEGVTVTGTRGAPRTKLTTPVPVDVIDISKLASVSAQVSVGDILNYLAPSFSSNKQSIQDGTDHIDPASLRGMGVDQVLVLVNGKRLHQSSLVNFQIGPGRGQVGTDLNTIPTAAIERIEILRDGAAAQYGSDAIAGVINIILKKGTNQLQVSVTGGANFTNDASLVTRNKVADGEVVKVDANYGLKIGKNGGFLNLTGSYDLRGRTDRTTAYEGTIFRDYNKTDGNGKLVYDYTQFVSDYGATETSALAYFQANKLIGADITNDELKRRNKTRNDYQMIVGQAGLGDAKGYLNFEMPLIKEKLFVFATGGINYREGRSSGYYRLPSHRQRYVADLYMDGYLPHINSRITDYNTIAGVRANFNGFNLSLSNTYGGNKFLFLIDQSVNTTYEKASKKSFDAGGHAFYQNTVNLDLSKKMDVLKGLNIALGGEYRSEEFQLIKGEEQSYSIKGNKESYLYTPDIDKDSNIIVNKGTRPGGSQVFPGYSNQLSKTRSSFAAYLDAELDVTKAWMVGAALRYENYSDFGSTLNYKLLTRLNISDVLSLRLAYNTGFRAPSLHQIYFENTTTQFVNGNLTQVAVLSNVSSAAKALGIPGLKAEQSSGFAGGFTLDFGKVTVTTDIYNIRVSDRIVFTDAFSGKKGGTPTEQAVYDALKSANAEVGQFFINSINTVTRGLDLVATYKDRFKDGDFRADLALTFSKTQQDGETKVPTNLEASQVFPTTSKIILENVSPVVKGSLGLSYSLMGFTVLLRNSFFGEVIDPNVEATINGVREFHKSEAAVITDLSLSYTFNKYIALTIGSNNILDVYPTLINKEKFPGAYDDGRFRFQNAASQFGYNGRFLFARLNVTL